MPVRPREMNDQPTESRIRQIIRAILNQEVRRLLTTTGSLSAQVATNITDIAQNAADINNNTRRGAARNNEGLQTSLSLGLSSSGVQVTDTTFTTASNWTLTIADQPIQVTLWVATNQFTPAAEFDTQQFDMVQFDESEMLAVHATTETPIVTYIASTNEYNIAWGSAKSGTLYLLNFGSGAAFAAVAVAD